MSGALLRLKAVGVVGGFLWCSLLAFGFAPASATAASDKTSGGFANEARAPQNPTAGANASASAPAASAGCIAAMSNAFPLSPRIPDVKYPRYQPVDAQTLRREDLTSVLDVVSGVHVNQMVRTRLIPVAQQSALGANVDVPGWVGELLDLDESARPRLRSAIGRTEFGKRTILITDVDGELRAFDLAHHKEFQPGRRTMIRMANGGIVRISPSRFHVNTLTGRTVRDVELLPEDGSSPITDFDRSDKEKFNWLVAAKIFSPLEWMHTHIAHGVRRGLFHERTPVLVFDVAGRYYEMSDFMGDYVRATYDLPTSWLGHVVSRFHALKEIRVGRPIHLSNGKILIAHAIPHPSDSRYRVRAVEVLRSALKIKSAGADR